MEPETPLDVCKKLAHIDQILMDHDRNRQEKIGFEPCEPWKMAVAVIATLAAGAALFAAGAAFTKFILIG